MPAKTLAELALQLEQDIANLKKSRSEMIRMAIGLVNEGYRRKI